MYRRSTLWTNPGSKRKLDRCLNHECLRLLRGSPSCWNLPRRLPEQLVHGPPVVRPRRLRHVLKPAMEGIVVTDIRPVDPNRGVDGRLDIFRVDLAILRPAEIGDCGAGSVGGADHGAALYASAGHKR